MSGELKRLTAACSRISTVVHKSLKIISLPLLLCLFSSLSFLLAFSSSTVGVYQGCLPSAILLNLFLEKIMQEKLHDHHTSISIGGRPICSLEFASDSNLVGGSSGELQNLTNRLIDRATAYAMEVSTEKSKVMTNSTNNINANIIINGQT